MAALSIHLKEIDKIMDNHKIIIKKIHELSVFQVVNDICWDGHEEWQKDLELPGKNLKKQFFQMESGNSNSNQVHHQC